ncbi:MAG: hypothetical protein HFJ28_06570 [Clostridia bacterium]|nr:hypothetical protein [Clostridia bacterium]
MDDFIGGNYAGQTDQQKNAKKWMKLITVMIVLLLVTCIALVGMMYYLKSVQLKITLDGVQTSNLENVLIFENGKVYIPIRNFASYVGYESSNGDYNQDRYTEDTTKCYVKCSGEVATFSLGSNKIYKTLLDGSNDYEYYEINEPIRMINNQLCTTIEGASIAFNISMAYEIEQNRVTIFTLPYLVNYYTAQYTNAAFLEGTASFSNQKALLYDMVIVKNTANQYGVYDLNNREILGTKYTSIKFVESTKEFIVTTAENKMGIMSHDSSTKISPEYDQIKQIDKDTGLYLVTNNNKYGVINGHGSTIIFTEYDQVGIDSTRFSNNGIQNQYLLYNNCIPVRKNNIWTIYDKTGRKITDAEYTDLGCTAGSSIPDKNASSILLIPKYEGIVVKEGNMYGIIDSKGERLVPSVLSSVYSTTSEGKVTYSMIYESQEMNVITYIETYVRPTNNEENKDNKPNNEQTNNEANTTTNNTTTNEITNNEQANNTNEVQNSQKQDNSNTVPTVSNAVDSEKQIVNNIDQTMNNILDNFINTQQ